MTYIYLCLLVRELNLQKPQYLKTASYGHFGNPEYSWEKPKQLKAAYEKALKHNGPSLVEVITDPNALSMPPEVEASQIVGFATSLSKIALNRGAAETVAMARSNLRNASAWRQF